MWFVAANTNTCRIFHYNKAQKSLTLVKELSNPLAKMKGSELVSDRPGHFGAEGGARGAFVGSTDPKQVEIDDFAIEIAKTLEHARNTNQYDKLIIAAQPHMNGKISKHLDHHLKDCIVQHVNTDYTRLSEKELLEVVREM